MINKAIQTTRTLLPNNGSVTIQEIENAVNIVVSIPMYADIDKDILIREIQAIYKF